MIYKDQENTAKVDLSNYTDYNCDGNPEQSGCLPIFQWSYFFNYHEKPYTKENTVEAASMNYTTFVQNPIFNKDNVFDELPENLKFNTRCWLPDKYIDDYLR